jgi:hypothetical protein
MVGSAAAAGVPNSRSVLRILRAAVDPGRTRWSKARMLAFSDRTERAICAFVRCVVQ